jgi:hypothetical protein
MKTISRICLFGALTLILLTVACTGQEGTPTSVGTTIPTDVTSYPPPAETEATFTAETATTFPDMTATPAATDTAQTSTTPVTGEEVILLECQYCIERVAHALLILPDTATYEVIADTTSLSTPGPDMGCHTVDTFNGRQTVLCRGEENTSLNLNICTDGNNCTQLLVELHSCPVTSTAEPGATNTPEAGIPTNTATAGATDTPAVVATDTPVVSSPTATP